MLALFIISSGMIKAKTPEQEYYQMKVYSLDTIGPADQLDDYLKEAYIPAIHRAGIKNVGVFKTIRNKNENQHLIIVLIPYNSISQFEELTHLLEKDHEYNVKAKNFFEASHEQAPYLRMESILMRAFKGFPNYQIPDLNTEKRKRIYELRSYQSATEALHQRKVDMFDSGESDLFVELGFQPIFFGSVLFGSEMPNLMYMTCHADEETQKKNWNSFGVHPKWQEMKKMEKYKNTVSHIDKWMLYTAEYSDF
jgi:hypothetical protein